ncbi:uncharacterized protein EI97DRAFT_446711 [Westerdykella ornata]|uniref:Dystroglycan-type cadherin-like domain-containing protein n=1 Tax=Westerdykella ornata TaxID=318751 RepID=A0A6A6J4L0_WESOR|nr:uncharacterized protein EI97DRAFT_446711 [Westerdykella ornata]KAF2271332.1 hypothetical protein EI97DRAFT_446711 [Westerdykella ornata]
MAAYRLIVMWATATAVLLLDPVAAASPQVNFPLNSQFPPVARVGQPYFFKFASTTFQPKPDDLQYSLIGNPSWLALNGENQTLSGTPGAGDIGEITFIIAAAGEAGAVANMESRLLVTDAEAPIVKQNVSEDLATAGPLSGPQTLTLGPSKSFEVKFPKDTFSNVDKNTKYYASLADHTPLPAWISFDEASLRFAGITPAIVMSAQTYDMLLIASDNPGFAAATMSFSLVISYHQLSFNPLHREIILAKGDQVNITGLLNFLFMDGAPMREQDIKSASAILPSWLSFNDRTLEIAGKPPSGLMSQDITVSVEDVFGDTAEHSIHLLFKSQLFRNQIGTLNITAGKPFEYQIPSSVFLNVDETVSLDFGPLSEWLKFDTKTLIISGSIPENFKAGSVEAMLSATSADGKLHDSQTFLIQVLSAENGEGSIAGGAGTQRPNAAGPDSDASNSHHHSRSKAGIIAGSVVGAVIGAMLLFAFGCILCRRKKNTKGYFSPRSPRSPRKQDISRPIMIHDDWDTTDREMEQDLEKGDASLDSTPEGLPQLKLDLAPSRDISKSPVSSIGEGESKILSDFAESDWGMKDEAGPSHRPHDSMKIPTAIARRESDFSTSSKKHRRRTTMVYRDSQRSNGLPVNRRLSGLGHGWHAYSPSRSNSISEARRTLSSNSTRTVSTSILSTVPSAHARPLATRHTTSLTTPMHKRCSIRVVSKNASTCASLREHPDEDASCKRSEQSPKTMYDNLADRRTLAEKRQSYIRKRASAQSPFPFFGASSSRVSSSSYKPPTSVSADDETGVRPSPSPLATSTFADVAKDKAQNQGSGLPECLRIRKPSDTPTVEEQTKFPGSLHKPPTARSFTGRQPKSPATVTDRDRVYKRYQMSNTTGQDANSGRRSSVRESVRAQALKASLNSLTGSKIFEDAEASESAYSSEEEVIEEYEKRTTAKPSQFPLPPLDLYRLRHSRRNSKQEDKEAKDGHRRELKKISQRDPTPYPFDNEHGGKENEPHTLNHAVRASTPKDKAKSKPVNVCRSPERPKTIASTTSRSKLTSRHSRSNSRITTRSSTQRRPLSRQPSNRSRHSRTQSTTAGTSRPPSRHSTTAAKAGCDRSRTQSSAYPYFDISTLPDTLRDPSKPSQESDKPLVKPEMGTMASLITRDVDGNILNYGLHERPTIEELASTSIGMRASKGKLSSSARESRLAQEANKRDGAENKKRISTRGEGSKRNTVIVRPGVSSPVEPSSSPGPLVGQAAYSAGLGLSLGRLLDGGTDTSMGLSLGGREDTPGAFTMSDVDANSEWVRERTPLSVLDDGNGGSPERLRVVEGKGKRPISKEVDEELKVGASRKARTTTWGSLKRLGMGWGYWEGRERERESKAFL